MLQFDVQRCFRSRIREVDFNNLVFGAEFSDHLFGMEYDNGEWGTPKIRPYGPLTIAPSLTALHYGQTVFEGMKAFRQRDGQIAVFRLEDHFHRFNRSAQRLCMPEIEYEVFEKSIMLLLNLDAAWVPRQAGSSLYIRPVMFGTESVLGVRPSRSYIYLVITCPVGAYYAEGFNPVSLITSGHYSRTMPGGLGQAKTAANYAATMLTVKEAKAKGFSQVLWLDGKEHKYIDEVSTMNVFFHIGNELITPTLEEGTVLAGITRDSVMQLAHAMGLDVVARRVTIKEIMHAGKDGRLKEAFGTGTAAVISPIGELEHNGDRIVVGTGKTGPLSKLFFDEITGIQYGEKPDRFGWCYPVQPTQAAQKTIPPTRAVLEPAPERAEVNRVRRTRAVAGNGRH